MAKPNISQLPGKLFELLKDLEPEERQRVVAATLMLFGEGTPNLQNAPADGNPSGNPGGVVHQGRSSVSAKAYMDEKDPHNKGETLAVAARFRELNEGATTHTKEELKKIFSDARRNFDDNNYARDMKNIRNQACFFNKNTGKGSDTLSYYGQNYVDALPDREAAKQLKRPKTKSPAKKKVKKKAKQSS